MEMLMIMHESPERGRLVLSGAKMDNKTIARLIGCEIRVFERTLKTLLEKQVAYVDEQGVIYNNRMVRDEALRLVRKEAGHLGGNPILVKQKQTTYLNQKSTPSSSFSSSTSYKEKIYKKENFKPPEVFEVENYFIDQKVDEPQKVASDFFDYWSTRGWIMKSGHSMKNWKSACSTWIKNLKKFKNGKDTEQKIGRNTVSDITEFVNRRTVPDELL